MKFYRITDEQNTWWAEFRTDGMADSVVEKIVSIKSKFRTEAVNPTDLHVEMIKLGLPNKVGTEVTQAGLLAFCTTKSLRLIKQYESLADNYLRASTSKDFISYTVPGQVGGEVIDTENATITIGVTAATDISALIATFVVPFNAFVTDSLSNDQVSGVTENDFTNDVTMLVYSETPMDSKEYTITIDNLSDAALCTGFDLAEKTGVAVINDGAGTIAIEVVALTDVTDLVPTILASAGATISPASGVSQDFTNPVVYTVTSQDLTVEKEYTVTVTVAA